MRKIFFIAVLLFVSVISFSQTGKINKDSCYVIKETDTIWYLSCMQQNPPQFPGGDKALFAFAQKNIMYPQPAHDVRIQGKVYTTFVINKNGEVVDVEIYKGVTLSKEIIEKYKDNELELSKYYEGINSLNSEALRVIKKMPKWTPGMLDGKPVKVRYIFPFSFKLQ